MKRVLWMVGLVLAPAVAVAQEPADTGQERRVEALRIEIERRFAERVRADLRLTDDQANRLKATQERFGVRRRELMRQQMQHRMALQRQMQPGYAANADSVRIHMDGMQRGRADLLKVEQDEDREMAGYMTPVQRAQFQMMRQRFLERVMEMRGQRGMRRGEPGPGPRGREGPRDRPPERQRPRQRP
jgi:hypothetical protein